MGQTGQTEISVSVAARILRTSRSTVLRLIEIGEIKARRSGRRGWWIVNRDSILTIFRKFGAPPR